MPPDPDIQDQMLELIYGLLADNEAERLRAKIGSDAELARLYEQVRETAAILGDAARLQSPRLVLARPPAVAPASGEPPPAWRIVEAAGPPPWSRGAYWAVTAAASILILLSAFGWSQHRAQTADSSGEQLRLRVTGPSLIHAKVDQRYTISTLSVTGRPIPAKVSFAVVSPAGSRLLAHTEQTDEAGKLEVTIPADLDLPEEVRLEIVADTGKARESAESRLFVLKPGLATSVSVDKPGYRPGETVRYRSVTLSRYHLAVADPAALEFEIVDPLGRSMARFGSDPAREGVASGSFALPSDAGEGRYTLLARASGAVPARCQFRVEQRATAAVRAELDFAQTGYGPGAEVWAALKATGRGGAPASGAKVDIEATVDGERVYQESASLGAAGDLAIRFQLPGQIERGEGLLTATIDDRGASERIAAAIPIQTGRLAVRFFPEGGELAAAGENRVYFTARDALGRPVDLKGWIVDDIGAYHAAVETVRDGRGVFRLAPEVGKRYRLLVEEPKGAESAAQLPLVSPSQRIVLNTGSSVVAPAAPLEFNVRAAEAGLPLVARASCGGVEVGHAAFLTKAPEKLGTKMAAHAVAIPLPDEASGVIRLTIFDYGVSPPRPLAERLVYRRPSRRLLVDIKSAGNACAPGDRCRLEVAITDEKGKPVRSILGVSVIDEEVFGSDAHPPTMTTQFRLRGSVDRLESLDNPDFLLSQSPEAELALDLLLGTEGERQPLERLAGKIGQTDGETPARQRRAWRSEIPPPLMLDNLAALKRRAGEEFTGDPARERLAADILLALVVLGGAGLLVLVAMLSLLRIASGIRLWAPTILAAGASLLVGLLLVGSGQSPMRAVAFLPYQAEKPGENRDDKTDLDGKDGQTTKEVADDSSKVASPPQPKPEPAGWEFWSPLLRTDEQGRATVELDLPASLAQARVVVDAHGAGRIGSETRMIPLKLPDKPGER